MSCGTCSDSCKPKSHDFSFATATGIHYIVEAHLAAAAAALGDSYMVLYVLPPGATSAEQAIVEQRSLAAAQAVGFTAVAAGTHTLHVDCGGDCDAVTAVATAVGTVLHRALLAAADGAAVPLDVDCYASGCRHSYGGTALVDGDGSASVLRIAVAEGTAYAFALRLPPGQPGVHIALTIFEASAAGGASGFSPLLAGPLGVWRETPPGHQSWYTYHLCADDDRACLAAGGNSLGRFATHVGGGNFGEELTGTWVAATAGDVLLELALNCDVPFYGNLPAVSS